MSFFSVHDLSAGYAGSHIVQHISFSAQSGQLIGILGANGSGKTTLLKAICGILPHSGTCTLKGAPLEGLPPRKLAQQCSYIPQRSGISIDISALDVVLMGFNPQLRLLEHPSSAMRSAAEDALRQVGLGARIHDNYQFLSEGQKQLCILARTLVADSPLLLLDEPESALDFRFRYDILHHIQTWLHTGARCGIVTLHDPSLALNFCDRLIVLDHGTVLGQLHPGSDATEEMEAALTHIYGDISLLRCQTRSGQTQLVMLKE